MAPITGLTFSDAGLPSTVQNLDAVVPAAKGILAALNEQHPDAIMVELGDGIMGHYGVDLLLKDAELMGHARAHVLCANDLVGAWGGLRFLGDLGLDVDCVAGPATDNSAGRRVYRAAFRRGGRQRPHRPGPTGPADRAKGLSAMSGSGPPRINVAILGASGYIGGEALRLLVGHPYVNVVAVTAASHAGQPVSAVHPNLARLCDLTFAADVPTDRLAELDAVFLALPHGEALRLVPEILAAGGRGAHMGAARSYWTSAATFGSRTRRRTNRPTACRTTRWPARRPTARPSGTAPPCRRRN